MKKYFKKYIGPKKIKSVKESNRKTLKGDSLYMVEYISDEFEDDYLPKKMLEETVTKKKSDWSTLENKRLNVAAEDVIRAVAENNIKVSELDKLFQKTKVSLQKTVKKATEALYGKEERTILDVDEVLKSHREMVDKENKE